MGKDKLHTRWGDGIFLVARNESSEIIVGTNMGVVKARAFRRKGSEDERWNREEIERMKGTPWEPIPGRRGISLKTAVHLPQREAEPTPIIEGEVRPIIRRRIKITKEDIKRFGITQGCRGCERANRGGPTIARNEDSRQRIEGKLLEVGDKRIEIYIISSRRNTKRS